MLSPTRRHYRRDPSHAWIRCVHANDVGRQVQILIGCKYTNMVYIFARHSELEIMGYVCMYVCVCIFTECAWLMLSSWQNDLIHMNAQKTCSCDAKLSVVSTSGQTYFVWCTRCCGTQVMSKTEQCPAVSQKTQHASCELGHIWLKLVFT